MKYKRVLLKLSGEALAGSSAGNFDHQRIRQYAKDIKDVADEGTEIAVVIGGGNIFRGLSGIREGVERVKGDYMGMLATIINSMVLMDELEKIDVYTSLLSGLPLEPLAGKMSRERAIALLESGHVVLISGGTGNPFFTTDSAAVLRALEIGADVILKGTRVDGVYTADPEKDSGAVKYDTLSYDEALGKGLKIMDLTAFTLCKENNMPVIVFDMNTEGNLLKIITGEHIGTLVA